MSTAGGGGSGYCKPGLMSCTTSTGNFHVPPISATTDPDYIPNIAVGGHGSKGGDGQVVIYWESDTYSVI
jgi:hypothetical protein